MELKCRASYQAQLKLIGQKILLVVIFKNSVVVPVNWVTHKILAIAMHGRSQTKVYDNVVTHLMGNFLTIVGCFTTGLLIDSKVVLE